MLFAIESTGLKITTDDTLFDCVFALDYTLTAFDDLPRGEFLIVLLLEVCSQILLQVSDLSITNLLPPLIPQMLRLGLREVLAPPWATEHRGHTVLSIY